MASITSTTISHAAGQAVTAPQQQGQGSNAQQSGTGASQSVLISQIAAEKASQKLEVDDKARSAQTPKRTEGTYRTQEEKEEAENKREVKRKKRDQARGQGGNLSLTI